jgi:4-hydroxy-tetrahydrodipicolinate synthase
MARFRTFTGCGTALVTPFRPGGALDEAALGELVDFQIAGGIDFLVPCGTTGESVTLTLEEHLKVVEIVVGRAAGRVPVVAGAGGYDTRHVVELARALAGRGVDGLLSVTPYYNKPTQEGLYRHYEALAGAVELPIVLYNVPGRTAVNLLPATVARLAALDNVVGVKEASGSLAQMTELAAILPAGFALLAGDDGAVLPLVALGGHGVVSVVSNLVPGRMARFTRLCLDGRLAAARAELPGLLELTRGCFLETNPIPVKAGLSMMGRIAEVYRLPLVPMAADNRRQLAEILRREGVVAAEGPVAGVAAGGNR